MRFGTQQGGGFGSMLNRLLLELGVFTTDFADTADDGHSMLEERRLQNFYSSFVNKFCGFGDSCSTVTTSQGYLQCLQILLSHSVDGKDPKAQTLLIKGVSGHYLNRIGALLLLLRCGGTLPSKNVSKSIAEIPLRHCTESDAVSGAMVWTPCSTGSGSGPLYQAAVCGHLDCFRVLLLYGADPNYSCPGEKPVGPLVTTTRRKRQRQTVLELCVRHGLDVEFIRLLIEFGANVYLPTLIVEKSTKQNEALELLLRERGSPRSLVSQCRLVIRRQLVKVNNILAIDSLELPPRLIDYLKHKAVNSSHSTH